MGYGLVDCFDAVMMSKELDESNYRNLVEFDYTGSYISMEITANKNIAVIWDWGAKGISYISAGSTEFLSHMYSPGGVKNVVIAEYIAPETTPTTLSTALKGFDLTSHADKIVGASNNPLNLTARGIYLKNAINTLPSRVGSSSESKNWNVVWDSEVQY